VGVVSVGVLVPGVHVAVSTGGATLTKSARAVMAEHVDVGVSVLLGVPEQEVPS
jgi:hypothetical protein